MELISITKVGDGKMSLHALHGRLLESQRELLRIYSLNQCIWIKVESFVSSIRTQAAWCINNSNHEKEFLHSIFKQLANIFNLHLDATNSAFTGQSNPSPQHRGASAMEQ